MTEPRDYAVLIVYPHSGYGPDQIDGGKSELTLRRLRDHIDSLIEEYGPDTKVITYDPSNRYGAQWGYLDEPSGEYVDFEGYGDYSASVVYGG